MQNKIYRIKWDLLYEEKNDTEATLTIMQNRKFLETSLYIDAKLHLIWRLAESSMPVIERIINNKQETIDKLTKEIEEMNEELKSEHVDEWKKRYIKQELPQTEQQLNKTLKELEKWSKTKTRLEQTIEAISQIYQGG